MHSSISSSGQSALEYLFLLAGGIVIVIIILLSVIGLTPLGELFFQERLAEYEQIDVCTGQGATCSLVVDWVSGLSFSPPGVELSSSNWRELYVDGFQPEARCGTGAQYCTSAEFVFARVPGNNYYDPAALPATSLELPIAQCTGNNAPTGTACAVTVPWYAATPGVPGVITGPACSDAQNDGIWECTPCSVASANCFVLPNIPFCPTQDTTLNSAYSVSDNFFFDTQAISSGTCKPKMVSFSYANLGLPDFPIRLGGNIPGQPSIAPAKIAVTFSGDVDGSGQAKRGNFGFRVHQISNPNTSPSLANSSTQIFSGFNYFSTDPAYRGSFYTCDLGASGAPENFVLAGCQAGLGQSNAAFSSAFASFVPGLSLGSNVIGPCRAKGSFLFPGGLGTLNPNLGKFNPSSMAYVEWVDLNPILTGAVLPGSREATFVLEVADFNPPSLTQGSATAQCNSYQSALSQLQLYRIPVASFSPAQRASGDIYSACQIINSPNPGTPIPQTAASPNMAAWLELDNGGIATRAHCNVGFDIDSGIVNASEAGQFYIGIKRVGSGAYSGPQLYTYLNALASTLEREPYLTSIYFKN